MSGAATDTFPRGFSFMPASKLKELQYIEGAELERTWKSSQRLRLKEREQKIWEHFVKEQDVLNSVCEDDPYQFLEDLPEDCLKELMEVELQKLKQEAAQELEVEERPPCGDGDSPHDIAPDPRSDHSDDCIEHPAMSDSFHIFDDDKDDEPSIHDDEAAESPCTVREAEKGLSPVSSPHSPDKSSSKSLENVSSMIESSIYCARIKDLRRKVIDELLAVILFLERRDIFAIEPEEVVKMCRRSAEFCGRFNRIYMYQIQRQVQELKRHTAARLPLARHTQFQAQAARAVAVHQSLLQALQVFLKSLEQTGGVKESGDLARAVCTVCGEVTAVCAAVPAPRGIANDLYTDDMLTTCERLDEALSEYTAKMTDFLKTVNGSSSSHSRKTVKSNTKKRSIGTWPKNSNKKTTAESKLSMYSLDTLRKAGSAKTSTSDDARVRARHNTTASAASPASAKNKKTPRARGPLMRAPPAGRPPADRALADSDVLTMVENVGPCMSRQMSCEGSPRLIRTSAPATSRGARRESKRPHRNNSNRTTPRGRTHHNTDAAHSEVSRTRIEQVAQILSHREQQAKAEALAGPALGPGPVARGPAPGPGPAARAADPVPAPPGSPAADLAKHTQGDQLVEEPDSARKKKTPRQEPVRCEVTRIVKQLCGGDNAKNRNERVSGAKNAQLFCVSSGSPRQPSTPQLLKILEETIQKKVPKSLYDKSPPIWDAERFRLPLSVGAETVDRLFAYRTRFVQHMLASPMYANCARGKPWELVGSVSEHIIDELLLQCAKEMQLDAVVQELYRAET